MPCVEGVSVGAFPGYIALKHDRQVLVGESARHQAMTNGEIKMLKFMNPTIRQCDNHFTGARCLMVEKIREIENEVPDYPISEAVLQVMNKVPRHHFVPADIIDSAYYNDPLPIHYGQTISQPYIVALMTELLKLDKQGCVLEIGTGSGYQTAVLAELANKVCSMEIIAPLAARAEKLLMESGYENIRFKLSDGNQGWVEYAPFDAIIVTAAARRLPDALINQLKPCGRMVIPIGNGLYGQDLILITKSAQGVISREMILPVSFVPLRCGCEILTSVPGEFA
jgi:protein-L-isoaspartate(D-aspartate) O-methyltransferase